MKIHFRACASAAIVRKNRLASGDSPGGAIACTGSTKTAIAFNSLTHQLRGKIETGRQGW
jgi:hypothetical protein